MAYPSLLAAASSPDELHRWVQAFTGLSIPRQRVCAHHHAPFEYLRRAYFEPGADLVVWAPRGGGKTHLGALATLLDLLHKPACHVRILGGSLEQSMRMWEHLYPALLDLAPHQILGQPRARRIALQNGSSAAVLTQSQRAVRGLRVQKLRCDEVELFDPLIWQAAQLITRTRRQKPTPANDGGVVGSVEALSTLHTPFGLMHQIVESATKSGTPVIRWCLLDVLQSCESDRSCESCPLSEDCRGVARAHCAGFVPIDDAIAMKQRVSRETWDAEMLCRRPSQRHAVFPHYNEEIHVAANLPPAAASGSSELSLSMDFGFASPFVCLWILTTDAGLTHVLDEYVQPSLQLAEHLQQIATRAWGRARAITCDPAGSSRSDQTGTSNVALLRQSGFAVRHRPSSIVTGLELIRAALAPASGPPRLFIHPRCHRLRTALRSYRYAEGGSELPIKDGEHDHLIDALRYHFINHTPRRHQLHTRTY